MVLILLSDPVAFSREISFERGVETNASTGDYITITQINIRLFFGTKRKIAPRRVRVLLLWGVSLLFF